MGRFGSSVSDPYFSFVAAISIFFAALFGGTVLFIRKIYLDRKAFKPSNTPLVEDEIAHSGQSANKPESSAEIELDQKNSNLILNRLKHDRAFAEHLSMLVHDIRKAEAQLK